jgi:hypothetical protein
MGSTAAFATENRRRMGMFLPAPTGGVDQALCG